MPTSQSSTATAAERAHTAIRTRIASGGLRPGDMLSESDLAASLGVSRTPVRAALTRLADEGWIVVYPQRGALVRGLTDVEVAESAEVRHALETAGVRGATPDRRAALADDLAANLGRQERALRDGDLADFAEPAAAFHRAFAALTDNETLLAVYDRLHDRQVLSIVGSAERIRAQPEQVLAEHHALLLHAVAGDAEVFAAHLEEHQRRSHALEGPVARR